MVFIPNDLSNWRKRRSVLFMPSSNQRALAKAPSLECDGVIFDLEDAVAASEQNEARHNLLEMVKGIDMGGKETAIRTSAYDEVTFDDDLKTALDCETHAILVPKVDDAKTLQEISEKIEKNGSFRPAIWAMIETPKAILNIKEIAASGLVNGLVVGPNDLAKETGTAMKSGRAAMLPWLMMIILAARANGLSALDGVYNNFSDISGLSQECAQGADMGFDGKTLIHPKQINSSNLAFSPTEDELARARAIIELFEKPENTNKAALQLVSQQGSEMVERLHLGIAKQLISAFG